VIGWDNEMTVQCEGTADIPTGTDRDRCLQAYLAQYPDGVERAHDHDIVHVRVRRQLAAIQRLPAPGPSQSRKPLSDIDSEATKRHNIPQPLRGRHSLASSVAVGVSLSMSLVLEPALFTT
jgi:hypothetical protein